MVQEKVRWCNLQLICLDYLSRQSVNNLKVLKIKTELISILFYMAER